MIRGLSLFFICSKREWIIETGSKGTVHLKSRPGEHPSEHQIAPEDLMTRKNKGHYAKKHPPDRKIDQKIVEALKEYISGGKISCAAAFRIVRDTKVSPSEVGFVIDVLEISIAKCQLGLFGYRPRKKIVRPANSVSSALEDAIRQALVKNRLSCAAAWEIAENFGLGKMEVTSACEALRLKISSCQLGAF